MQNGWNNVISNISVGSVNTVNYLFRTWERLAPNRNMDLYSLEKFKKYKNDWNYPVHVRYQDQVMAEKEKPRTTFQTAMKVTLTIGQCFGLNPVQGIREKDASKLRFKLLSGRCLFTFFSLIGQFIMAFVLFLSLFKETSSTVDTATALIFYSFGFTTTILFFRIATNWPKLCMHIAKVESVDPNTDNKLGKKFNIACISILFLALMEHLFSELHGISIALDCFPDTPVYESFMKLSFQWLFGFIPYSDFAGGMAHFSNLQCTFNWNFADVFVICMSMYLTARLEQVNQRIIAAKDKNSPSSFWRTMREDYNRSVHLVRQVDKIIGGVVFMSFASNLFFVCSQLLHTLAGGIKASQRCKPEIGADRRFFYGYEHSIYFVFSFSFLVIRSLAVSLTASKVHAASLEPAYSLYDVSSANYCVEVERFLDQIHGDTVALSGLQFFHVKRGLVLTIAGTIVTYELVLMQFTGITPTTSPESVSGVIK
uniref:Gustatory receptor n=1 Tax=Helicoverpa armigera TaxID=29058 RepID=A0A075TD91_HELAM|nr:gustatory receptor [Helicoverpa armigera]ASW18694.1 gustatory receptor 5 [Helicoverpa armigera]QJR83062.1 gustatory receptor 5 [Helicoverpa armigera]